MDADRIVASLQGIPANFVGYLAGIRACEGTAPPEGYRALYGWKPGRDERLFSSFAEHPHERYWIKSGLPVLQGDLFAPDETTTAAGAYQITYPTWSRFVFNCGPHDFSPDSQDKCALWLIENDRDAAVDVLDGNIEDAVRKCSNLWASLPYSTAGQRTRTLDFFLQTYTSHGGALACAA